jgi:hypothetical protein
VFKVYWDKDVASLPWTSWVDAAIEYFAEHESAQAGDTVVVAADDERVVLLTAVDPHNSASKYVITMTTGEDSAGNPALVVSDVEKV